jgi:alanine dehydrogenase
MKLLLLDSVAMTPLLDKIDVIDAVEHAFAAYGRGEAHMPPKVYLDVPHGDFRAMPAAMGTSAIVKWVNSHTQNPDLHGLPTVMAILIYNDAETGRPLAVMDGTLITQQRTAAAAAVATRHLARKDARTLGLVGCGGQAVAHLRAIARVVRPERVLLADLHRPHAERVAAELADLPCEIVQTPQACAADVVTTLTGGRKGFVQRDWVRPGAHINAMGADAAGKQELTVELLLAARVFVDDWAQAAHSGEINVAFRDGKLKEIAGTLPEVICGKRPGRASDDEITIFDSTGLAIQDLALARALYDDARRSGAGRLVDFSLGGLL